MEPPAGGALDQVEDVLAVAEGEEDRRQGAELDAHVAEEEDDVGDAAELEEQGADPLGPWRRLDAEQLLGGQDERHLVAEAAEPVDPVDEGRDLGVGADLGQLLVAAVHVAGHRLGPHHLLSIEADDDAQRAVGRRVLRADVEGHALGLELHVDPGVGRLAGDVRRPLSVGDRRGHGQPSSAASPPSPSGSPGKGSTSTSPGHGLTSLASSGKSLRSGWPFELAREIEVAQPGMADEVEAVHLPGLPLVPVRPPVQRDQRVDLGVVFGQVDLQGDADLLLDAVEAGEDLEAGVAAGHAGHEPPGLLFGLHRGLVGRLRPGPLRPRRPPAPRARRRLRPPRTSRRAGRGWASSRDRTGSRSRSARAGPCRARRSRYHGAPGDPDPQVVAGQLEAHQVVAELGPGAPRAAGGGADRPRSRPSLRSPQPWVGTLASPAFPGPPRLGRHRSARQVGGRRLRQGGLHLRLPMLLDLDGTSPEMLPPPTTNGSPRQRSAMFSPRMRCWSSTMPSSRASGRGGQPGT